MGETEAAKAILFKDTEEFIENYFPIDIKNWVTIDCNVSQHGFRDRLLSSILKKGVLKFPLKRNKKLKFKIIKTNVKEPYEVRWKVRNVGEVAERRDMIRGQIIKDDGYRKRKESSDFYGPHYVECYIIKDGICVARQRIDVPISTEASVA